MKMEIEEKLRILSGAAKYDVSCVSSGSTRKPVSGGLGNAAPLGICHSFTSDGRCVSLLKILYTNRCIYDCSYCVNRRSLEVPRATFTEEEVISLTMHFYVRNYIEGLFLSSGIYRSADHTMERLIAIVKRLRTEKRFNGYIHLKALPGADAALIRKAGLYADRLSANIELPSREALGLLAPQKDGDAILHSMKHIGGEISRNMEERKKFRKAPAFVPAGQSTQLIIGASPDRDMQILKLSQFLYRSYALKRVFYSAYMPVSNDPRLPALSSPPLQREHRLYQADWLLRFYGFRAEELFSRARENLEEDFDPKTGWALDHRERFPLEVNRAPYEELLRVPGIGVRSARKILVARRVNSLSLDDLKRIGVVMKRARHFVTARGHHDRSLLDDEKALRALLSGKKPPSQGYQQLSLFSLLQEAIPSPGYESARSGEF